MAATFISTYPARQIAFAWDTDWRPNWRVNLIPSYKTHRLDEDSVTVGVEQIPDTLSPQISAISEILDAIGVARPGQIEFEADDILGTLVAKTKTNSYVVTGDRDLFQLVNDRAKNKVISMNKGMKNLEVVDDNYLLKKYGITGKQYAAFSTLRGDSSDGLPGIKGIGEKTASTLVAKYGSVEGVIRAAKKNDPELKASTKENILASTDYLAKALEVVTVRTDAKLPKVLARPIKIKNPKELVFIANDWGVVKQVNRLLAALDLPKI